MQKKILAMAVAAAVSAPAFADTANVTVYGKMDVSYDSINTGNGTATVGGAPVNGTTSNRIASNVTTIGFKGAEDLGDGLAAVWQIEQSVNVGDAALNGTSTTKGFFGTRNTFLGLKSDSIGTVLAGRHDTPYKLSTRRFDVFGDGIADNRSLMGSGASAIAAFDNRQDQVIAYVSPSWAGVNVALAHVNLAPTNSTAALNKNANSFAVWYDANGLYGTVAYEEHNNLGWSAAQAQNTYEKARKVGFGYTMEGVFNVNVVYEKTSDNMGLAATGYNLDSHNAVYVSGKYSITEKDTIKAAYTKLGSVTNTTATGAKQVAIGYDHALSKRTTVYALYTKINNDSGANYGFSGEPTIGGASTVSGFGASPRAIAIGTKVVF